MVCLCHHISTIGKCFMAIGYIPIKSGVADCAVPYIGQCFCSIYQKAETLVITVSCKHMGTRCTALDDVS